MIQMGDLYLSPVKIKSDVSKFDVTLMVDSNPGQYILYWEYNSDLFLNTTIERMASHYVILLQNIFRYSEEKIEDIDYVSVNEKNELVDDIRSEEVKQYEKETLIGQFEKCVKKFPDNIAIESADRMITYEELNQFADNVAADLRERDCRVGDIIGIWADTSCERIAAVLGVLKVGAAYMPIDVDAPIDRIKYMMKNSGAKYILRDTDMEGNLDSGIVTLDLQKISCKEMTYTHEEYSSDVAAYLIYTSGSTGNPKGVLVNNKNIVNQVYWHIKGAQLDEKSIFVQNTAFIFDGSVLEIFSSLLSGGRLRLIHSDEKKEPEKIIEKMENAYINILPSMFRAVMEYAIANGEEKKLNSFKHLGLVAEKIPEDLIERYIRTEGSDLSRIWNLYGPTETTITATFYHLNNEMDFKHVPIGYPVTNYRIYILRGDKLCGHGVVGEICISGVGVSSGYINNKELTDKVFVKNLFGNGNMYRTGDTGYLNEKNEIVILGRVDEQVKVRGFRVELQEIEKQIMSVDGVKEAVVVCKKDSANNYLVAYYEGDVSATKVQIAISDFLPSYMVPEYIISLDQIPHLPNGKIDKKSLETREIKKKAGLGKPKTEVEKLICGIYEEVLGIETVGRDDNFFEVGGDSIKAIRIVSKLRNAGYDMSVKKVMQLASPKLIAKTLSKIDSAEYSEEEQVSGKVRLAPIQKRFFETGLPNPNHFNQSAILTSREPIDITAVNNSLQCLVEHHDQLRATFNEQDQVINAQVDKKQYTVQLYNIKNENLEKALQRIGNKLQTKISMKDNRLINCAIVESPEIHALILCIHHLIIDAVSWEILVEDLNELYSGFVDNKKIKLSNKTLSYKQWTDTLNEYYLNGKHKEELEFWKETVIKLRKSDEVELREHLNRSKEFTIIMPQEVVKPIIENGRKILSMNANELLLAIFLKSFSKCMNTKGTSFMIESHGRPELDERLAVTRTIGWFTTLYPVVFECIGQDDLEDLRTIKETLRSIPNYGIGYDIARDSGLLAEEFKEPLITFNYFGNRETQNVINSLPLNPDNYDIGLNIDENNKFGTPISINAEMINGDVVAEISYVQGILEEEKITQFKECINKQAQSLKNLFEEQQIKIMTPSDYYQSNMSLRDWDVIINKMSQQKETLEDIYDLSPMQEGMLYDKLRDVDSLNYVLQTVIKYKMFIDNKKMEQAVYRLANVHEILKTHVFYDGITQPKQVIPTERVLEYKYKDFSTSEHAYEEFEKLCASEHKKGFQLEKDSLIRFALCRLPSDEFRIIITAHHIIMDGWSLPIIVNDLMDLYTHDCNMDACITKPKYSEYIRQLKSRDSVYKYWRKILGGIEEKTTILPLKNNREPSSIVAEMEMVINDATTKSVEKIIQRYQVTMNTFIEAVWGITLQRYNDVQDAIFGKVVSGRNVDISHVEKMVGLFINTIPVRVQNRPGLKFYELLGEVQTQSMESSEYDNVSLMRLQEELGLGQDSIQTILAFENYFVNDLSEDFGYDVENAKEQTDFDLALAISKEEQLKINLMYKECKYSKEEMEYLLLHLKTLVEEIVKNPQCEVAEYQIVCKAEQEVIVEQFNKPISAFKDDNLVRRFEKTVEMFPNQIAVECGEQKLTYKQLNSRANYVAQNLLTEEVKQGEVIGIAMERSCEMLIAIVGVLKAGGAYLPIDPKQPEERIKFMLEDSGARIVIANEGTYNTQEIVEMYRIMNLGEESEELSENISTEIPADSLAYIIYTSGTTGNPKGVQIEHRNVIHLVEWFCDEMHLGKDVVVMQSFAFIFDGSVWEIFPTILSGSTLRIATDEDKMSPEKMLSLMDSAVLAIIPSLYRELLNYAKKNGKLTQLHSLEALLLGAEALPEDLVDEFYNSCSECGKVPRLINAYGPTEATVCCSYYEFKKEQQHIPYVGKAIPNTHIYIVNGQQMAGVGMTGEVCVSGNGVARGYLNREELTQEKFVYLPFVPEGKVYRTGDLGRWTHEGNIELLGRIGEQVKIRGFRIELEEIAQTIRKYQGIEEAAVIYDREDTGKLIAYYVSKQTVDTIELKDMLNTYLVAYMIPDEMIRIEAIPRTLNGKIDKKQLPKTMNLIKDVEMPKTMEENAVYTSFQEALGLEKFSINDNFFLIGGNSLKAISVMTSLKRMGYEVTVREILKYRTVKTLSHYMKDRQSKVKASTESASEVIDKGVKNNVVQREIRYKATELQKFYLNVGDFVKESVQLKMKTLEEVESLLNKIVEVQSILRSEAIKADEWEIMEMVYDRKIKFPILKTSKSSLDKVILQCTEKYQSQLCETKFPLTMICIVEVEESEYLILLLAHHCIWDKSSSLIWHEIFDEAGIGKDFQRVEAYSNYIEGVRAASDREKETDIVEHRFVLKEDSNLIRSHCACIELSDIKMREFDSDPWRIVEDIVWTIGRCNHVFVNDRLPVVLIQDDRSYLEQESVMMLGECLDFIPIELEGNQSGELYHAMEQQQQFKTLHKINYIVETKLTAKDIRRVFDKTLILNYQGQYEMDEETADTWLSQVNDFITTTEIYIGRCKNKLLISYPIFEGCESNLETLLLETCK